MCLTTIFCTLLLSIVDGFLFGGNNCDCPEVRVCPPVTTCPPNACALRNICVAKGGTIHQPDDGPVKITQFLSEIETKQGDVHGRTHGNPPQRIAQDRLQGIAYDQPQNVANDASPNYVNYYEIHENTNDPPELQLNDQVLRRKKYRNIKKRNTNADRTEAILGISKEAKTQTKRTVKCNNKILRKLMYEAIQKTFTQSKTSIYEKVRSEFGGNIDVVCSEGYFSYIYTSKLHCEVTRGGITCIAFQQYE